MTESPFQVLLYYKYVAIEAPELYASDHLAFCQGLGLRGRILVAREGINGTVSGSLEATRSYMERMGADPRFSDMKFKADPCDGHVFKRLSVKARQEIVTLGLGEDVDPGQTAPHLSPRDFLRALLEKDTLLLDVRSDYETRLGHFRNAICPEIHHFRELPAWIRENVERLKGRKVLTYCTGGIRCEKAAALLLREGVRDVAQLKGGIIDYGKDEEVKGRYFDGKCYVFDERIKVEINQTEERCVISHCQFCGSLSDRSVNCSRLECDEQFICCEACESRDGCFCSGTCQTSASVRS